LCFSLGFYKIATALTSFRTELNFGNLQGRILKNIIAKSELARKPSEFSYSRLSGFNLLNVVIVSIAN